MRVVIVGAGSIGRAWAQIVSSSLPAAEVLHVSSRSLDSVVGVGQDIGGSELVCFAPDIVILANPATQRAQFFETHTHLVAHYLIEKPVASALGEALQMENLLAHNEGVVQIGYNLRFSPSLRVFKEQLDRRMLGKVLSVRVDTGQYLPDWRPDADYRDTVSAKDSLGGGVLRELSHEFDYLRWIFGEMEWVSAWLGKQSSFELDVEDTAHVTVGFQGLEDEPTVVAQVNLDFVRRDAVRQVTAVCEEGSLRWDGIANTVAIWKGGPAGWEQFAVPDASGSTYQAQWDSFTGAIANSGEPEVTLSDGIEVLRVIEAIRESHHRMGQRVEVATVGADR